MISSSFIYIVGKSFRKHAIYIFKSNQLPLLPCAALNFNLNDYGISFYMMMMVR